MAEREASGDFDYLSDIVDVADADEARDDELPEPNMAFDAFDERTWYFEPAPPPWYRTKPMLTVLVAASVAAVALVVSGVLLMFRGPGEPAGEEATTVTPTAQTTAAPARTASAPRKSPPPPAAPPPVVRSAAPAAPPPAATNRPPPPQTRATRDAEFGVTRTPVTRSPISVAPRRPGQAQR
ncbi:MULTISPECIES: hypothetical protein [unclassified Mycobacterium]|uniref:hypothetical protein n=1 Tax=unclassified Mycobacterium TaxID=2642494 RepID=UPI0007404684|nr:MULTISPECIES: hypothetical protein [unclassified Mycobacterium]KUH85416.1 hypothetical protein AU186_21840 [Mycobacterium sp. GA-1999]KUH91276.1 hypothetical protein AU185_08905 [Mycobacterium sp. GA-0227b]KUH96468.1 hypothetical protein AU187_14940 [Mycobacterium sp. IS-1556]